VTSPRRTPGSQTSLREANRTRIIDALKLHGRLTQVELAGATGLSPATVSNIVKELTGSGLLHTSYTSRSGRRATEVTLARRLGLVAGLHFSTRQLRIAVADVAGTVVAEHHVPLALDHRHDAELDRASLMLADMLDRLGASRDEVLAIGLGLPAPIDPATDEIGVRGLLRGWEGVPVADAFQARTGRPVFVDSEANLGARAEAQSGAGRGAGEFAYIRVGHLISAGLVIGGRPFRGATGKAGQIGHVTIDENGPICRCGSRGCLETLAAAPALLELFRSDPSIHRLHDLVQRAAEGDAGCQRAIADAGRHIGVAAASLANLFDPQRIVIGGELAEAGESLLAPLRHALERSVLIGEAGMPEVVPAVHGERAELVGALRLAIESMEVGGPIPIVAAASAEPLRSEANG
jgi:predicted NBD/HSP70 family sugar kinase